MTDPRTPVIVGVGQVTQRPGDVTDAADARSPVDLMVESIRLAADDAQSRHSLVDRLEATWVSQPLSRRYPDPGALVNRRLDREDASSARAVVGGNSPQLLVNEACAAVARGDLDVVAVTGGEAMYSRFRAKREGVDPGWEHSELQPCQIEIGDARPGTTQYEELHGAGIPVEIYPLFETALRAAEARGVEAHQKAVGRLWARFSQVAAANPHAWTPHAWSAEDITSPAPDNRVVTFPYTKRMCANMTVDQAAALLVTSLDAAKASGVPEDRLVFPVAGADAHDHFSVSERWSLTDSPALDRAGRAILAEAGHDVDNVAAFDLYACFPSAVEVACRALGIGPHDERPLTLTGGLSFFGGPGNNYTAHAIAATVAACREDPGSLALVTGVGWYLTKHAVGLYSTSPPVGGFTRIDPGTLQAEIDALPRRQPAGEISGLTTVEATAVVHDRTGRPERAVVAVLTDEGRRGFVRTDDRSVAGAMVAEAWEGRRVRVEAANGVNQLVAG